ncbi:MAG: cupredoxin domain-containing protein [bacterium]|nr:cupredoxin domain-containing protein [bacterium]
MSNKIMLFVIALLFLAAGGIYLFKAPKNNSSDLKINQSQASADEIKEINLVGRQWSFEPAEIIVNQGDKVRLNLTSADVPHGLAIKEYGINQFIKPGETATVEFTADQPGEFTFYCNVFCGGGHREMTGKLIVR